MLRLIGILFAGCSIIGLCLLAIATYIIVEKSNGLPDESQLARYEPNVTTRFHSADGSLLSEYAREHRLYLPIEAIPKKVIYAFISAEDKNFYNHSGIDWWGVARAVRDNVKNKLLQAMGKPHRGVSGASTITQQVAKNFFFTSEKTLDRKIKEALLAQRIENTFSKDKIMELYLNKIYFGYNSHGIATASLNYFGKSLDSLAVEEIAFLAALPKAPNYYDPKDNYKKAIDRRNWVLGRMVANGYLDKEKAAAAKQRPINIRREPFGVRLFAAESFAEEVRREVYELFGDKLYTGGLSVRTTLDVKMQVLAKYVLRKGLTKFDQKKGWRGPITRIKVSNSWADRLAKMKIPSDIEPWRLAVVLKVGSNNCLVGLRPKEKDINSSINLPRDTGIITLKNMQWARKTTKNGLGANVSSPRDVLHQGDIIYVSPSKVNNEWHLTQVPEVNGALVAMNPHNGRIHALVGGFSYGLSQFNRAVQAQRQPGSSFKPFVYAAALDNGYNPSSVIMDAPIEIRNGNEIWRPKNYGGGYAGPSTLRMGIEKSRNLMTIRLARDMGMATVVDYAGRFGIYDNLLPVLSMSLGAGETTLLKMTTAFGILANGGKEIKPTVIDRVQDRYGRTVFKHDSRSCNECQVAKWSNQEEPELEDSRKQVINTHTAYQITSMLEGVVRRGTAAKIKKITDRPLAGKTGTTNDEKDAWFVGFSSDLVVGVFVGYDNPKPMGHGATGGSLAAPIFAEFMKIALHNKPYVPFRVPEGINLIPINIKTGKEANYGESGVILEAFKPGEFPSDNIDYIGGDGEVYINNNGDDEVLTGSGGLY